MKSLAFVLAMTALAVADSADDRARAIELFEEGRKLLDSDPAAACDKFTQSIQLEPQAAGTMLNLGLCSEALGKYKTALDWFRKAQLRATETDPPLLGAEKTAREHANRLVGQVATIRVVAPAGATVAIDGEPVKRDDFARVEIDPGHHALDASVAGKPPIHREVDVSGKGGDVVTLEFGDDAQKVEHHDDSSRRSLAFGVGIGGGALLLASLGLTLYEKQIYEDNAPDARRGDLGAIANTRDATAAPRDFANPLAVAGLVAVGLAAYFYLTAPEATTVAPAVAPNAVGVTATRRF